MTVIGFFFFLFFCQNAGSYCVVGYDLSKKHTLTLYQTQSVEPNYPVDTGRKLKVHKTFGRRPARHLNVLRTFNLRPVSAGT